jgi:aspartokinase-like uncharacterized kinase
MTPHAIVVKVGGSLFACPDLIARIRQLLQSLPSRHVALIPGGGAEAKALRPLTQSGLLSEEEAHWRCIGIMTEITRQLSAQSLDFTIATSWRQAHLAWVKDRWPWLLVEPFLRRDDARPDHLPHDWTVSSDSIAARLAAQVGADLILLKSCPLPRRVATWQSYARRGIVDPWFPCIANTVKTIKLMRLPTVTASESERLHGQSAPSGRFPGKPLRERQ